MIGRLLRLVGLKPRPIYVVEMVVSGPEPWDITTIPSVPATDSYLDALGMKALLERDYGDDPEVVVQIRRAA